MHELSLAQHLLDLALEHAGRAGAQRVLQLHLVAGELAPLEETSLAFYWEQVTLETPAQGSKVGVRRLPLRFACLDCKDDFETGGELWSCPKCGSQRVRVQGGDECYLEAIDVETEAVEKEPA